MDKKVDLNIYLLKQSINNEYDTFDSAVVIAENEEEARKIHPSGLVTHINYDEHMQLTWMGTYIGGDKNGEEYVRYADDWVSYHEIDKIEVTKIGKADDIHKKGVLLASFNAG